MKSFTNTVVNNWRVELDQDSTLRQFMPMLNFTLDNSGDSEVDVFLHGESVGSCYGYATFSVMGKPFESFRIEGVFNIGDLTVNVSKMEVVTAMPFNPQIDLMEENLDKFASGTDTRISYSSDVSAEAIKYMLNLQGGLIVQRKLDVLGGASVGSYEIDFNEDIISGSTAINFPSVDLKRYKKTIPIGTFDYTFTDCSVAGWLLDYQGHTRTEGVTSIATNPDNAVDSSIITFADKETASTGVVDIWQIIINPMDINNLYFAGYIEDDYTHDGTAHHQILTSPDGSNWTERGASGNTAGGLTYYKSLTGLGLTDITHIKVQASNCYLTQKIYDVSFHNL